MLSGVYRQAPIYDSKGVFKRNTLTVFIVLLFRDLMNTRSVVPDWLLDLLMGYLDPAAAHYSRRPDFYEPRQNWFDTFLSADHLRAAFPQ